MVSVIPEGVYTMQNRMSIIYKNATKYQRAKHKVKSQMLNELSQMFHMNRKYLALLLRNTGKVRYTAQGLKLVGDPRVSYLHKRGRKKRYTQDIVPYLKKLWSLVGYRSSVHLVAFIRLNQDIIFHDIPFLNNMQPHLKKQLLTISSATVDRRLRSHKERLRLKHRYRSNPHASVIKKRIPVEPYFKKPKGKLGYLEMDLVHHCGSLLKGNFVYTLTATEINTDWTELRALRNKAQVWTHKTLQEISETVPFDITALHSDNGSEFINAHIERFTRTAGIQFTRSRVYHKNDAPYVESKNWTMVRSYTGYRRYDTEREFNILSKLNRLISIRHNYFIPTMKLARKERIGTKIIKRYDVRIPYHRVLASSTVSRSQKTKLRRYRATLNYLTLVQQINKLQKHLDSAYHKKYNTLFNYEEE